MTQRPSRSHRENAANQRTHKTPVLSLVNATTGEVRSRVVADVSGTTLRKVITEQVNTTRSHLDTDEGMAVTTRLDRSSSLTAP